jgi:hypothetical protein
MWTLLKITFLYVWKITREVHNNLDCHNSFEILSTNYKVYMLKVWHKSKMFLQVQNIQTSRVDNPYFFQTSFFFTKCAPFLLKIGKDFIIDD